MAIYPTHGCDVPTRDHPQTHPHTTGADENQVNMTAIVPQRIDSHGSKVEDIAGTGEHDAPGG